MTDWRATAREVVGPLARRLVLAVALAVVVGLVLVLVNLVLVVRGADEVSLGRSALRLVGLAGVAPALAAWLTWQAGLLGAARVVARTAAAALARVVVGAASRRLGPGPHDDDAAGPGRAAVTRSSWTSDLPWPIRRLLGLGAVRQALAPLTTLVAAARGQGASAAQLAGIETELAQRLPALVPAPRWWPVLVVIGVNLAAWWLV
ncbi:MAG: hypothetical protein KBG28_16050 [Kofleriaceae bacterium]|nr:hypothetical protein [Kofleriaceae bacterium]